MPNETDPKQALVKLSLTFLKCIALSETLNEEVVRKNSEPVHHLLHLWHTHLIQYAAERHLDSIFAEPLHDLKFHKRMHLIRIPTDSKILYCNNYLAPCLGMYNCRKGTTQEKQEPDWMPGVKQLEEAGVTFKALSSNFLDIKFCNGQMIIPKIFVQVDIETQLRNLIAFEQCCLRPFQYYVSSYVQFLDDLINTSKDVKILREKGVLKHGLGDDEQVVQLFSNLTNGVLISRSQSYLSDTYRRVNEYRSRKIHKWRARLVRDYFYDPWAVISNLSYIAAILALILTGIQTFYSVSPPKH